MQKRKFFVVALSIFTLIFSVTSCSDEKTTKVDFFDRNEINLYKNETYAMDADWGNYSFEVENEDIIRIDQAARKIYGLQEGKSNVVIKASDGSYDECVINVLSISDIKSVADVYALDENKLNFITLYVAENNNGIIRYMFDVYEGSENATTPFFTETVLHTKEGLWSNTSQSYEIISTVDTIHVSPETLEYGDMIICHYDYKGSDVYNGIPSRSVYNLYYTGLKAENLLF